MRVTAIDVSHKPNEIPDSKWLVLNKEYTVIDVVKCNPQGGLLGYELEEIQLGADELPYKYFAARRFAIPEEDKEIKENVEELIEI